MKHGRNRQAIDFLAVAKEFDHENSEIYMVRGCALANMVKQLIDRKTLPKD